MTASIYERQIQNIEDEMEALEKSLQITVDLFLVDINMPIMDGYSFVKIGSLTGALSDGVTLEGNSYDVDITLITNLLDTNYSVHEVAGTGSEFVTIYDSTTTITIEEIE